MRGAWKAIMVANHTGLAHEGRYLDEPSPEDSIELVLLDQWEYLIVFILNPIHNESQNFARIANETRMGFVICRCAPGLNVIRETLFDTL